MNRVQTVTQKHYRVKNPGQNPNWLHEPQTGPASAPGAPRRAPCLPMPRTLPVPAAQAPRACPVRPVRPAPSARQPSRAPAAACPARPLALRACRPSAQHLSHNTKSVSRHTWAVAQFYFFCTQNFFFFSSLFMINIFFFH